jgi:hypothetical protein
MKDTLDYKEERRVPVLFSELRNGEEFEWCATPYRDCRKIDEDSFSEEYGTVRLEDLQGFGSSYDSLDELELTHLAYVPVHSVDVGLLTLWDDDNWTFPEEARYWNKRVDVAYRACLNGDFTIAVEPAPEGMKVTVCSADDKVSLFAKVPADENWINVAETLALSCAQIYKEAK